MKALHTITASVLLLSSMSAFATDVTTQDIVQSMDSELTYQLASAQCEALVVASEQSDQGAVIYQEQLTQDPEVVEENTNTDEAWVACMQEQGVF